jgi:rod shape-determining protein MreD
MTTASARTSGLHVPRVVVGSVIAVMGAFVVQTAILPAIGLSSAIPVVFAVVVVLAMAWGPTVGPAVGFGAGLLLDLTGTGILGVGAMIGCLLGLVAARIPVDRWRWSGAGWAMLATMVAGLLYMAINAVLVGRVPATSIAWVWLIAGAVACILVLVPARTWLREAVR